MIFYESTDEVGRVHLTGTQADARNVNKDFKQVDVPVDKAGLRGFVQKLYDRIFELSHEPVERFAAVAELMVELNAPEPVAEPLPEPPSAPISYTAHTVEIDEIFENLPLAHQLHLAAFAMENARSRLKSA